jgi:hypothetical protein
MSPWISIAISTATTVILGLLGLLAKRELGRIKDDFANNRKEHAAISAAITKLGESAEEKYLSKDMFDRLDASRKEIEKLRKEQDQRLEGLLNELVARMGGRGGENPNR